MTNELMHEVEPLYDENSYEVGLKYKGLDMQGLSDMNVLFGSEKYGTFVGNLGVCSITFAKYYDGTIGAVRNMDLQLSNYCGYEVFIEKGENVKYNTWALAYTAMDEKSYEDVLKEGVSDRRYKQIPFTATDAMSFGYDDKGNKASLYCGILMRSDEEDENGNYIWTCPGTYKDKAPIRCCTQSAATLIAVNCVTIDEALKLTGAVDEKFQRLFPNDDPTLDVYTFNIENEQMSNHWFEVIAMEDASGRHGVLEFLDNYAIWHEGIDYSFNFFLQKEYFLNPDGTYREKHGAGIGRYKATVPYLKQIRTLQDHVKLMDNVSYSHMTYYTDEEEIKYVGYDYHGNRIDWRSEHAGSNPFRGYDKFKKLGLSTEAADKKYKLWANYLNTETKQIEKVDSYDYWLANKDHLVGLYDLNYVQNDNNKEEIENYLRWTGAFYSSLTAEEIRKTNSGWMTFFRVIADPMHQRVTRWFNEMIVTADTYTWKDMKVDD